MKCIQNPSFPIVPERAEKQIDFYAICTWSWERVTQHSEGVICFLIAQLRSKSSCRLQSQWKSETHKSARLGGGWSVGKELSSNRGSSEQLHALRGQMYTDEGGTHPTTKGATETEFRNVKSCPYFVCTKLGKAVPPGAPNLQTSSVCPFWGALFLRRLFLPRHRISVSVGVYCGTHAKGDTRMG